MKQVGFRQKRTHFFIGTSAVHDTFTRSVYVRVAPCTRSVYPGVYIMPAKWSNKAADFPHTTRGMAPKHRRAAAFLLRFSLR
ncbi:MAG: hypothetical protein CVU44_06010 [Chloroflexi bacterium HGW-Chloroflexi-6]|nr:MAG: hypothetical protein CVU44_06010 [Chloroflexi bacterium HGW-Chloroflexi-6]